MNRDPRTSSAPSQTQAAAMHAGQAAPFRPCGNPGMSDREGGTQYGMGFTTNQQAEASCMADGWDFRLLV